MRRKPDTAIENYGALRAMGIPRAITAHEAWCLSGGLKGQKDGTIPFPLAEVAKVPDCLHFAEDYWAARTYQAN